MPQLQSRVVIGPYQPGIDLSALFSTRAKGREMLETSMRVDVAGISSAVFLTRRWAELQNPWRRGDGILLATHNDLKTSENDRPLRFHDVEVENTKIFVAGPDSEEEEVNAIEISRGKVHKTILEPLKDISPRELRAALSSYGTDSLQRIIGMGEDREMVLDPVLKLASVWDDVRQSSDELVRECFENGAAFPGKRVNELQNAVGGAVNLMEMIIEAEKEMRARGYDVSDKHHSYVSCYLKYLEYHPSQPLPEEGIFITALERDRRFLPLTEEFYARERAGEQIELNDFDVPAGYWGQKDSRDRPITIEGLRADPNSRYFDINFPSARAMKALAHVLKIPKRETPRERVYIDMPGATMASNLNLGEFGKTGEALGGSIGPYQRFPRNQRIESHADLENVFAQADATVIEPWPKKAPRGVDQSIYTLIRKLEARWMIAQRTTVKPLNHPSAAGRPIEIHRDIEQHEMAPYHNDVKFKTVTARADKTFATYEDEGGMLADLQNGGWEQRYLKPNPDKIPAYDLMDLETFLDYTNAPRCMFREGFLGSASSRIVSGNQDANHYAYETAKTNTVMISGGGSRQIMGQFYEGPAQAFVEGKMRAICVGVRTPIASIKEGPPIALMRKYGLEMQYGSFDNKFSLFGDGRFPTFMFEHLGERQHVICGSPHLLTTFIGGAGTSYEYYAAMYHNLMVEYRGYGIFPGLNEDEKIRLHFVNSPVKNGSDKIYKFYDMLKKSFTSEELEIMDVHFFDVEEDAFDVKCDFAQGLGFDLFPSDRPERALVMS
ncbi:MAG: hypothetical protein GC137_08840 [Alphaproteobacteria bacterium]|nr:hypothetical protein [Alphaproteobacteria bacterium]